MSVGKVTDTTSFIARAKEVHGDKYDYSQTVFAGAQSPITIVCKSCGPFTLAEAGTHYRTGKRPCGCRCQGNRKYKTCECGFVGYGKSQFPLNANGLCSRCYESAKKTKKNAKKNSVKCKCCGIPIGMLDRRVFCSSECRAAFIEKQSWKTVSFLCEGCGKKATKTVRTNNSNPRCCNSKCQKAAAAKARVSVSRWIELSMSAKRAWADSQRKRRQSKNAWFPKVVKESAKRKLIVRAKQASPWNRRCAAAVQSLRNRLEPAWAISNRTTELDWNSAIKVQTTKLKAKSKSVKETDLWKKKCVTISGTMRRRRSLRNAKQST